MVRVMPTEPKIAETQSASTIVAPRQETIVLTACMRSKDVREDVLPLLLEDDFVKSGHRALFRAVRAMHEANYPIDEVSLLDYLRSNRELDAAGGEQAVGRMFESDMPLLSWQTAYDELGPLNFIAEDLGYLTPGVRAMALTCGFPGMDVLEFSDYDVRCGVHPTPGKILYTSTHDTSTLAGWCTRSFAGGDGPSGVEVAAKLMGDALASDAPLVMMPLQDVLGLGDDARMNVPGVATGNWTWQADEADVAAAEGKTAQLLRNTHRFWGEA